jgi:hypothetical protein
MDYLNSSVQGIKEESSVALHALGQEYYPDGPTGRKFKYAKAGATALVAGKLCQAPAPDTDVVNVTVAASAAIGAKQVTIDAGGAVAAGAFNDGFLYINDATGEGVTAYVIDHHDTMAAAGEMVVYLKSALKVAVTVDVSEATLCANKYNGLIVAPTTLTSQVVGVAPIAVTANYYFWLQVAGPCYTLINGTPGIGLAVTAGSTTAGSVDLLATGTITMPIVGHMMDIGVSTEYKLVDLCID